MLNHIMWVTSDIKCRPVKGCALGVILLHHSTNH